MTRSDACWTRGREKGEWEKTGHHRSFRQRCSPHPCGGRSPRVHAETRKQHVFLLSRGCGSGQCQWACPPCRLVPVGRVAPLPPWGCGPHAPPKESGNLPHCHPLGGRSSHTFLSFLKKRFYLFIFRERGREGERRERNISVWLPLVCPLLGTWPTTQACALTGNQTGSLWFAGWHSIH